MRPRDAAEAAKALGSAHRCGLWWRCRCPVHQSRGASLALRDGERGLIVKCFAGCDPHNILAELRRRGLIGDPAHDGHRRSLATARPDERDNAARRIAMAQRIWDTAQDARGTPVVPYFAGRLITPSLRRPCCATRPRCAAQTASRGRRWSRA